MEYWEQKLYQLPNLNQLANVVCAVPALQVRVELL